jgi:hypothetical protein
MSARTLPRSGNSHLPEAFLSGDAWPPVSRMPDTDTPDTDTPDTDTPDTETPDTGTPESASGDAPDGDDSMWDDSTAIGGGVPGECSSLATEAGSH